MKPFYKNPESTAINKHNPQKSAAIILTCPLSTTLYQVANTKSVRINPDLKQSQVSFGQQEQAKAFPYWFSPHAKDLTLRGKYGKPERCRARHRDGKSVGTAVTDVDTAGNNCGQKSEGLVTQCRCRSLLCAEGQTVGRSRKMQT